jgi:hypothetical protein
MDLDTKPAVGEQITGPESDSADSDGNTDDECGPS